MSEIRGRFISVDTSKSRNMKFLTTLVIFDLGSFYSPVILYGNFDILEYHPTQRNHNHFVSGLNFTSCYFCFIAALDTK